MFGQWQFFHHKQLPECLHPLWTPRCARTPPIGLVVELSIEQQTNNPNRLTMPIVAFWLPFESIATFLEFPSFKQLFPSKLFWQVNCPSPLVPFPYASSCTWTRPWQVHQHVCQENQLLCQRILLQLVLMKNLLVAQLLFLLLQLFFNLFFLLRITNYYKCRCKR